MLFKSAPLNIRFRDSEELQKTPTPNRAYSTLPWRQSVVKSPEF